MFGYVKLQNIGGQVHEFSGCLVLHGTQIQFSWVNPN